jgi:hypothetical protein
LPYIIGKEKTKEKSKERKPFLSESFSNVEEEKE